MRKRHRHSPGGLAASTQGESGIMETVRPGPHLAGVLCNSLEVSSFACPGARAPRPAARPDLARPGRGAGTPSARASGARLGPTPSAAYTPLVVAAAAKARGSGPRGAPARGADASPSQPAARRAHLLEGPPGSRLARRAASVVTASPARPPARPSLAHSLARPPRRRGFYSEGWAESLARARAFATFLHFLFHRPPKRREGKGEKMSTGMKELRR